MRQYNVYYLEPGRGSEFGDALAVRANNPKEAAIEAFRRWRNKGKNLAEDGTIIPIPINNEFMVDDLKAIMGNENITDGLI